MIKSGAALALLCTALVLGIGIGLLVGIAVLPTSCHNVSANELDASGLCRLAEAKLLTTYPGGAVAESDYAFLRSSCLPCDPRTATLLEALSKPVSTRPAD